jgi:DeoR family galactitol utilization operon repressor
MTTHLVEGGEIVKAMKAHAGKTILVADSSKYGKVGFVSVLPLQEVDLIITDRNLSAQAVTELHEAAIRVQLI